MNWNNVHEKLPERVFFSEDQYQYIDDYICLLTDNTGRPFQKVLRWFGEAFWDDSVKYTNVTHWTPLLNLPRTWHGMFHDHDPNIRFEKYRCCQGHSWSIQHTCWCGWPNKNKP